jgi:hypothetical protein
VIGRLIHGLGAMAALCHQCTPSPPCDLSNGGFTSFRPYSICMVY